MDLNDQITKIFNKKHVVTIEEICLEVNRAEITVKKALAKIEYLTSYNFNSRFYTLPKFAQWDANGIWRHSRASFTIHCTLKNLIVWLVEHSHEGLSSNELSEITGGNIWATLGIMVSQNLIRRVRSDGQCFYFTAKSEEATKKQISRRFKKDFIKFDGQDVAAEIEDLKNSILVLLEIIRSKPKSLKALCLSLQARSKNLTLSFAKKVVDKYKINLKKN
jgi:hypothetical protein